MNVLPKSALRRFAPRFAATLLVLAGRATSPATAAPPASADPLAGLAPVVERALADWKVAGAAVAVVRDGKVVLARGFGVRAAGEPAAVDADTVFPIASLTKGLTAALAGRLADEKKLAWDDPLVKHLPGLAFADPAVTAALTFEDALSHRSGIAGSADFLWLLADLPREEILARLRFAPQEIPFRSGDSYRNVVVLAAGEAMARAGGAPWEALVADRLLAPLGMSRTFAGRLDPVRAGANVATPHSDLSGTPRPVPIEDPSPVAPAAAAWSSARDLATWARMLLGGGELDGKRVLAPETVTALLSPQTLQPSSPWFRDTWPESHFRAWGLGWVLQDYRGRLVAWNTGGLAGVSGTVALLPEEKGAVVVLTNGGRTSLPEALAWTVVDRLLGAPSKDWSRIRLERSLAARARAAEAESKRAVAGTAPLAWPLSSLEGLWENELLGKARVEPADGRLVFRIGRGPAARIEPLSADALLARWPSAEWGTSELRFAPGGNGAPDRFELEEIGTFRRVAPAAAGGAAAR